MKLTKSQLKQIVKEELEKVIQEAAPAVAGFGQSTVSVRVKLSSEKGPPPYHLRPEQEGNLGPGLKPGEPGEVPEKEWEKGGRVKFAWPRGVKGAGKRKVRYLQKDYLQLDPMG